MTEMVEMAAGIPEPPREPRWRTCLARRWGLALIGVILLDTGLTLWVMLSTTGLAPLSLQIVIGAVLGPGVVLLGLWLRGVLKLRVMLREGSLAQAKILQAKRVTGINPPHVKLRYRLPDDLGVHHEATQFVRAASVLGKFLLQQPASVLVVHDPHEPELSRAVCAADFLAT
jgi:hypothetical protein